MRVTQEQLKGMLPGQTLQIRCNTAAEWESVKRTAQKVKKDHVRQDGCTYTVSQNVRELIVTVTTTNPART